jgi:NAD(P)-dependent dehydrogenase (short-subunit alcohol dehydrogenase family)
MAMAMAQKYRLSTPAYKISKAALNMLTVQYAIAFAKEGFIFVPLSPGVCYSPFSSSGQHLRSKKDTDMLSIQ